MQCSTIKLQLSTEIPKKLYESAKNDSKDDEGLSINQVTVETLAKKRKILSMSVHRQVTEVHKS